MRATALAYGDATVRININLFLSVYCFLHLEYSLSWVRLPPSQFDNKARPIAGLDIEIIVTDRLQVGCYANADLRKCMDAYNNK